jgi:Flp pilus assembly protein TadG
MKVFRKITSRKGQALIEFALVAPLLILLVMGIFEFGRLWMTMNVLTGAAREGVRVAAITAPDVDLVKNTVQNYLTSSNITAGSISVSGPDAASEVTVTVQITYHSVFFGFIPGLSDSFEMIRSAIMHWES